MQDLALRIYVALENMELRARGTLAREDGQTGAEYVGIIAFVAAIVGALVLLKQGIADTIVQKIQGIIAGI